MPEMTRERCKDCENDFYNQPGNSCGGCCWLFGKAKLILRKKIHIDQKPPWKQRPDMYPDCYNTKGYVFFNGDRRNW